MGGAIAAVAAAVYANALANGLVWDDPIVLNRQLLAFRNVYDLVFTPRNIPQYAPDYYRPLTILTYLIDRAIGGTGPLMFHLSVVLFHVVTTLLVFRLGLALSADARPMLPAAAGAALFAVHPIHAESVAWGAGRSDVLACGFAVAAALAMLRQQWSVTRRAAGAASFLFVAMLAKETTIGLFVLLPFTDVILSRRISTMPVQARAERRRQRDVEPAPPWALVAGVPVAIVLGIYAILRQKALGTTFGQASALADDSAMKMFAAIGLYLGKLVLPIQQSAYISDVPVGVSALLATAVAVLVITAATIVAWRREELVAVFLVLWTAITLAPSLTIVVKIAGAPVAERYLYVPSVGFCLLVGYVAARLLSALRSRPLRIAAGAVFVGALAVAAAATVHRNAVWRSNLTLWEDTATKNTTDGLPMRSLAAAYVEIGESAKALEYFRLAQQRRNDAAGQFTIANNLGSLAMFAKRLDEAEQYYRKALAIDPRAPDCLYHLGLIALTRAMNAESDPATHMIEAQQGRQWFEQAARLSPLDPDIQVGLAQALEATGDAGGARAHYERAL